MALRPKGVAALSRPNKLAEKLNAPVIACDVSNGDDVENLITKSMEHFGGGFDFILHSIGMSLNVRKGKHYTEIDYAHNLKTFEISFNWGVADVFVQTPTGNT